MGASIPRFESRSRCGSLELTGVPCFVLFCAAKGAVSISRVPVTPRKFGLTADCLT